MHEAEARGAAEAVRTDSRAFVPISRLEASRLVARELAAGVLGLARRPRRDRRVVTAEYDEGGWTDVLAAARWRAYADLDSFLDAAGPGERVCKIENRYVRASDADYYRYRRRRLVEVMRQYGGGEPELVEIGCGFGANLFALAHAGDWPGLVGLDVSAAGTAAGTQIAQHFGLAERVRLGRIDLTDGDHPGFKELRGRVAYSYYCFEQLPHDTERVVRNLLNAGVRRVVHIEPIAELLSWWSVKDLVNLAYIWRRDYQRSLLRTLRRLEREGELRLLDVRRLYYAPTIRHDPAVVCWEPLRRESGGAS